MEVIWMLHGGALSRLRQALQPTPASSIGISSITGPTTRTRVPLEAFVTEVYRVCLGNSDIHQQRAGSSAVGGGVHHQLQARKLVQRICTLFDLVDIDSTGIIDWGDFTDFCVYMRGGASGGQEQDEGEVGGGGGGRGREDKTRDSEITRFTERLGYIDRSSRCHEIRSMRFVRELDLLMVIEGTSVLKIYAAGPHKMAQIEPVIAIKTLMIDNNKSATLHGKGKARNIGGAVKNGSVATGSRGNEDNVGVLAAEFIGRDNQAAVSCADGYLTVWELDTCKLLRYTRLRDVQVGLRFCPAMDVLASWGVDDFNHEIIVWDVDSLKVLHVIDGHSDPVKDICELTPPPRTETMEERSFWGPLMATAGMDGKVVVWDLRLERKYQTPKKMFILVGHYHGILSLAYSDEHDLIISAGFDFDANCWDRSTSYLHMKLTGHRRPLIGVVVVRHETQRAVTGDEGGSFRLWDIRRGHSDQATCLQAFALRNTRASPRTMVATWKEGLITAGSKMHVFRAMRNVVVAACPGGAWFSSYTGELCVLLREAVLLDASTGSVRRRSFQQPQDRDITAFCVDSRHKKAVAGDQTGSLRVYDGITGRWIMSAAPHRSEVSALLFMDDDNAFVSAGWDGMIQVHDARVRSGASGRQQNTGKGLPTVTVPPQPVGQRRAAVLRSVTDAHDGDITLMVASEQLGLLATASSDLTVRVWDYCLLRLEDVIVAHRQEITCVCFLNPLPCLATADTTGKVLLWATRPHPNARSLLVVIRNTVMTGGSIPNGVFESRSTPVQRKVLPTPVTCIAFRHVIASTSATPARGAAASRQQKKHAGDVGVLPQKSKDEAGSATTTIGHAVDKEVGSAPAPSVGGAGSLLFTGDELGIIKIWDMSSILVDRLGAAACECGSTEDAAAIPPAAENNKSHQFVYHRQGALDGVGLQAIRLREHIEIAKVLRRGDNLPSTRGEADRIGGKQCLPEDNLFGGDGGGGGSGCGDGNPVGKKADGNTPEARSCLCGQSTSSSAGKSGDRLPSRSKSRSSRSWDGAKVGVAVASTRSSSIITPEPTGGSERTAASREKQVGPDYYSKVTAVLNARVDNIDPAASWKGHDDSVTSMQVILRPPAILTGSLDSSARLFSLDGSLLGVPIHQNTVGREPWLFRPTDNGREKEASARAASLYEKLRSVRRMARRLHSSTVSDDPDPATDLPGRQGRHAPPPFPAPADGSAIAHSLSAALRREGEDPEGRRSGAGGAITFVDGTAEVGPLGDGESRNTRSALSLACLSRIREVTHVRAESIIDSSEAGSGSQETSQENIDVRLMHEVREGQKYKPPAGVRMVEPPTTEALSSSSTGRGGSDVHSEEWRPSPGAWESPPRGKVHLHLSVELQKKHAKRTRSALQFLSNGINRTGGSDRHPDRQLMETGEEAVAAFLNEQKGTPQATRTKPEGGNQGRERDHSIVDRPFTSPGALFALGTSSSQAEESTDVSCPASEAPLSESCSVPAIPDGAITMAPTMTLRLSYGGPLNVKEQAVISVRSRGGGLMLTQRSTASLASARSAVSGRSNASSAGSECARKVTADRRRRRMDGIVHGVRLITEQDNTTRDGAIPSTHAIPRSCSLPSVQDQGGGLIHTDDDDYKELTAKAGGTPPQEDTCAVEEGTTSFVSTRVRAALSRFDRFVHDDDDRGQSDQAGGMRTPTLEVRRRDIRTAAKQTAIRHNARYRRAQRFNLVTMKETQQRRQGAMVGLTGPSGERFGPYSLDDVLEFQTFASHLSAQGAEQMTLRGLMNNPGIQGDPYAHALLQDLARARLFQWNHALSLEDLMQVVFHFAKREELKRMVSAMDIALLLERIRDTFLDSTESLVGGNDGVLSHHVANDIDITVRMTGADVCGTCTLKEFHAMMTRAGSDLFAHTHEDLEVLAAQCGVDGHKELTAGDITAIVTKLALLRNRDPGQQPNG